MCGRLNIHDSAAIQKLMEQLKLPLFPARPPRYNVTPASNVDVVFNVNDIASMQWGIEFGDFRHPNTKVETIKRKPFLQKLLLQNRCLVPVNRFYEWPDAKLRPKYAGIKIRFCIHPPEDVMFLGGIYKINPDGVMQFNILTTDPTQAINDFHHRMPVIIPPAQTLRWLQSDKLEDLYEMTSPYTGPLTIYACDRYVDNGRHEGPLCMAPMDESNNA